MRAGRWERKSSRISILQLVQKDRVIKQRGVSRMPNFLSKQNRPVGPFRLMVCCQLPSDRGSRMNPEQPWNLTLVWVNWWRREVKKQSRFWLKRLKSGDVFKSIHALIMTAAPHSKRNMFHAFTRHAPIVHIFQNNSLSISHMRHPVTHTSTQYIQACSSLSTRWQWFASEDSFHGFGCLYKEAHFRHARFGLDRKSMCYCIAEGV